MKAVFVSPISITIELENNSIYYSPSPFDVYLNGKLVISNYKKNVFSLYDLNPNTK